MGRCLDTESFHVIKPEIRVLGVDDGKFAPHTNTETHVIGVVFRGGYWLDGLLHTRIVVDGFDATSKISTMIIESSHSKQLRVIMLNGLTFAGFNVVDIKALNLATNLPVITITREKPNLAEIYDALQNLPDRERRWKMILKAGEPSEIFTMNRKTRLYIQTAGITKEDAERIVRFTSTRSSIPEPLRVAHIIASGLGPPSATELEKV
jgi:endonuclease V-like protein UPF0215 family